MMPLRSLKTVVLAAGSKSISENGLPVLLEELGGKKIIDYVMEIVTQVALPDDVYVVIGYHQQRVQDHLGAGYHYVIQEKPNGTGEAVLALQPLLQDYQGDLLILYADTPLFSPSSIRGLINRHRMRRANLTLLTAVATRSYPYGRIIRDDAGRITRIIEESEAAPWVKDIQELNVGAYIAQARDIWPALEALVPLPDGDEIRLTDCV